MDTLLLRIEREGLAGDIDQLCGQRASGPDPGDPGALPSHGARPRALPNLPEASLREHVQSLNEAIVDTRWPSVRP